MSVPYAVSGGKQLRREAPPEAIYCPECEHWFIAGTRTVAERLFDEHLDEVPNPDTHTPEPF